MLSAAYVAHKDLLIRECDFTDSQATSAAYTTTLILSSQIEGRKDVGKEFSEGDISAFAESMTKKAINAFGLGAGNTGNAYDRVVSLDTYNSEIDTIDYMMHGQGDIKLEADGRYYNADGTINTYWTRNTEKTEYWNHWKEEKPEIFDRQAGEDSAQTSVDTSFGNAFLSTLSTRNLSFQNTDAVANLNTAFTTFRVIYNKGQIDSNPNLKTSFDGGHISITALNDTGQQELENTYGAENGATSISYVNADQFLRKSNGISITETSTGASYTQKPKVLMDEQKGTIINAQINALSRANLLSNTNLTMTATVNNYDIWSAPETETFTFSAPVNYNQQLGIFVLAGNPINQS
ncbi:MAG: hypothetical protein KAI72_01910, partial [Candidatus Pacebacteria bacterium]|nr:hypothetical protein [Candidatus Paceibacterota bacterium]